MSEYHQTCDSKIPTYELHQPISWQKYAMEYLLESQRRETYKSPYPQIDKNLSFEWDGRHDDSHAHQVSRGQGPFSVSEVTSEYQFPGSIPSPLRYTYPSEVNEAPGTSPQRVKTQNHIHREDDDFLQGPGYLDTDADEISDADSDYLTLRNNIAKYKDSVRRFRAEQKEDTDGDTSHDNIGQDRANVQKRGRGRPGGRGKGVPRGPRRAAEPTGDIKFRMGQASQAFIEERYDDAKNIVFEVIRINAETYEAWTLLASIWKELGELDNTVKTLMYAAHLRPKEVSVWLNCARFILEETGEDRAKYLDSAKFCYVSAIRADPKNDLEARLGKAIVLRELGNSNAAISDYKLILKRQPHDTAILRLMAETYIDQDNASEAISLYKESIAFFQRVDDIENQVFSWSDVNIYVELHGYLGQHFEAIKELRHLARWLLGRRDQEYWDIVTEDDREWDLEDTRRVQVPEFIANQFSPAQYGQGLPIELRIKLGLYRLRLGYEDEAMAHIMWLDPDNTSGEDMASDYPDLFCEVAESLQEAGLYKESLAFCRALSTVSDQDDTAPQLLLGRCYLQINDKKAAEECFRMVADIDETNIEARMQLARLYEENDDQEKALSYVHDVLALQRSRNVEGPRDISMADNTSHARDTSVPPHRSDRRSYHKPKRASHPAERERKEILRAEQLQEQYSIMCLEYDGMRSGVEAASLAWMEAARDLIQDFRGFRTFYPIDKYLRFLGYTTGAAQSQPRTGAVPLDADFAAMADRLSNKLGTKTDGKGVGSILLNIPENYRGIPFPVWLDIFLQYALCLVRYNRCLEAYEICGAARDAVIWYHSREDMFLIHVCWCACAVLANDEETCVSTCRFFMREYQFTTDSYRMFSALNRLTQSPMSWYNSGPTQKYILRQIKAMDFALTRDKGRHHSVPSDGDDITQNEAGQLAAGDDVDVCLLMVYGHILYSGASYAYALNYFLRAYAVDPNNPLINLSIGLSYIHYSLKRQAENRQYHVMQGMAFLFRYYDSRCKSSSMEERQEAHYNMARTYHLLGLTHIALPFYSKVLQEVHDSQATREDLVRDAAFNLQTLYVLGGNMKLARIISDMWLLI